MIYFSTLLLLPLAIALKSTDSGDTCQCLPMHPQTAFCNADFVMRGTVISDRYERLVETEITKSLGMPPLRIVYFDVLVSRVYKGFKKISKVVGLQDSFLFKIPVYASQSGAVCGVHLKKNTKYLIMGRIVAKQLQITHCNYAQELHLVSKDIKHGVNGHFDCNCPVTMCVDGYCDQDTGCKWDVAWGQPVDECTMKHKSCRQIADKKNPSQIKCEWKTKSSRYTKCQAAKS